MQHLVRIEYRNLVDQSGGKRIWGLFSMSENL